MIEGAFQFNHDIYHIKATTTYNLVKRSTDIEPVQPGKMVIYRDSDTTPLTKRGQHHQCGFDQLLHGKSFASNPTMSSLMKRGEVFFSQNKPSGCPMNSSALIAADCTYVHYYKNVNNARIQIINNFNMASALFESTFNVSLGLINITIMDTSCPGKIDPDLAWNRPCDATYALNDRLSDFSRWRSRMKGDGAGLWHLMTNCPTGVEVGLAWLKQLCNSGAELQISSEGKHQYVSGAGVSAITREEWKVVAHEIGHGFGAIHDCSATDCPCEGPNCSCCKSEGDQCQTTGYMMSAISNSSAQTFSPCSVRTICNAFPEIGQCLTDLDDHHRSVYQLDSCGNGVREEGEECDTGGEDTACCDAKTCKLKKDAVCEDKTDGCCHNCQIRPKTHVCRPAATPCDVSEYCTGQSPICPTDTYLRDGLSCGLNGLKCASGQCTSRNEQCLSRGFVMNITQSCRTNNEECKLLCNSPDSSKCLVFSGNFIDGTPCGFGGRCHDGVCRNGGAVGSSILYLREHLHVAIPISLIVFMMASAIGYILFCYGCGRCPGYKERQKRKEYYSSELQSSPVGFFEKRSISILSRLSFSTFMGEKGSIDLDVSNTLISNSPIMSAPTHSPSLTVTDEHSTKTHKHE
ncbi:Metallo-peptidase family M12-domain-containing protein [Choanephora cucurbitarum]|nr:Metallo-peptidase family M12-domain-containing protein [Choanephora cucurbitarum]